MMIVRICRVVVLEQPLLGARESLTIGRYLLLLAIYKSSVDLVLVRLQSRYALSNG